MMKIADAIVEALVCRGVTDAFGIPGGVILPLVYAMDRHPRFSPHLLGHEQSAGFAACGYAQASGRLGVAYATRGPGFTNLLTPMADAYCDSLPTLFITAHSNPLPPAGMRVENDQEIDTCSMVRNITKFAARIDSADEFAEVFEQACRAAESGRKGPVFLDIATSVFGAELVSTMESAAEPEEASCDTGKIAAELLAEINAARRPVFLLGDGIDRDRSGKALREFASSVPIPFLSSRAGHDLLGGAPNYYGYIGSHGIRAANFVLSKADLVVAVGNRLNFPLRSESFAALAERTRFIRCEIDETEFRRRVPNCRDIRVDANRLVAELALVADRIRVAADWTSACSRLGESLKMTDVNALVSDVGKVISASPEDAVVVADVGNSEFWLSRAAVYSGSGRRTLYSKSMGALGSALGKAIGAAYATRRPVLCVAGDQGLLMNLQELQYIASSDLPITVVVLDNRVSGMIRDNEERRYDHLLQVTEKDGYHPVDWPRIFSAFGVRRYLIIDVPGELRLAPVLPRGNPIQHLSPEIGPDMFAELEAI